MIFLSWIDPDAVEGGMKPAQVRHTCTRRLAELTEDLRIPCPFDADELAHRVARWSGTTIHLVPLAMPSGAPSGITMFTDDAQIVAYEGRTGQVHRDQIIAHELAHLILGHTGEEVSATTAIQQLFPALDPDAVGRVLTRTSYSQHEEYEAETMATILLELGAHPVSDTADPEPQYAGVAQRLVRTFEGGASC